MTTLTLTNLALVISQPHRLLLPVDKSLKVSAGSSTAITKSKARSSGEGELHWDDVLTLPFSFGLTAVEFQIATRHHFGYNPEELTSVIGGTIKMEEKHVSGGSSSIKMVTSAVYDQEGQKVGHLKVNIRVDLSKSKINNSNLFNKNSSITSPSQPSLPKESKISLSESKIASESSGGQKLLVSSVIAHSDNIKGKAIKLRLTWGSKSVVTEQFSSKSGQIVFLGNYQLKGGSSSKDSQIVIEVIEDSPTSAALGKALFFLNSLGKVNKKGTLSSPQGKQLGQMFVDGQLVENNMGRSLFRPMNDPSQNQRSRMAVSSLFRSSVDSKPSIVNSNHKIKFTKEIRFFGNLQDAKNPYVSYQDPGSMDFRQSRVNKYYRGASIGKGSKEDFTCMGRGRPGVGQYFLPTIWDRY